MHASVSEPGAVPNDLGPLLGDLLGVCSVRSEYKRTLLRSIADSKNAVWFLMK
jgi:hypothetical protein